MTVGTKIDARTDVEVWEVARSWLKEGPAIAVATVIDTWGSSPVPVGGQLAVSADQKFCGSVSGGCVENDVIVAASDVIDSGNAKTLSFGVSDETAWKVGLPCGGRISVYVERYSGPDDVAHFDGLISARGERRPVLVETSLEKRGRHVWNNADKFTEDIRDRIRGGRCGIVEGEHGETFLHAITPAPQVVVIGGTHIAQALVHLAGTVGYDVCVVDPRSSYVSEDRFSGVKTIVEWPSEALSKFLLDPYTAVVALAHVADIDDEALTAALNGGCGYVGALGSTRNHAKRTERLLAAGMSRDQVARIHSPIGLDIGAFTPAEIAMAIMAEIIKTFRGPKRQ